MTPDRIMDLCREIAEVDPIAAHRLASLHPDAPNWKWELKRLTCLEWREDSPGTSNFEDFDYRVTIPRPPKRRALTWEEWPNTNTPYWTKEKNGVVYKNMWWPGWSEHFRNSCFENGTHYRSDENSPWLPLYAEEAQPDLVISTEEKK